ncbi:MAG TPA: hypothetical protein VFE45_06235, partial [Coriobacteriia bacterium]|nr:hypothetical protein [Coriobacteriia bacterium]
QDEQVALRYVDAYARDADAFELLAEYVEHSTLDDADDDESIASVGAAPFVPTEGSEWTGLEGLELGVAGLVYALSTRGFFPAASCRSHAYEHSWSDRPVVLFAADRRRVEWLRPLVERAGCGFCVPRDRGQLLTIEAQSIVEMGALAQLILAADY